MTENPKKTGSEHSFLSKTPKKMQGEKEMPKILVIITNPKLLISLVSGVLQVIMGMLIICLTILGIIQPLWLSAVLSLLGSITAMSGALLLYHTFAREDSLDSLVNQAVKRVINSQN